MATMNIIANGDHIVKVIDSQTRQRFFRCKTMALKYHHKLLTGGQSLYFSYSQKK